MRMEMDSDRTWTVRCPDWPGFQLGSLRPQLRADEEILEAEKMVPMEGGWQVQFPSGFSLDCAVRAEAGGYCLEPVLRHRGPTSRVMKAVRYGGTPPAASGQGIRFGAQADAVRVLEQSNYAGQVRALVLPAAPVSPAVAGEPGSEAGLRQQVSQFFTVIYIFYTDDLSVHFHMTVIELFQIFQFFPCKPVVQHSAAQFGIRCLNRNIDRCQLHSDNTVYSLIIHIGQGNIIALQKRKP